jgi:hypothetical protein
MAAVNSFIFKKRHHKLKSKGRGCAFSDFMLPEERRQER